MKEHHRLMITTRLAQRRVRLIAERYRRMTELRATCIHQYKLSLSHSRGSFIRSSTGRKRNRKASSVKVFFRTTQVPIPLRGRRSFRFRFVLSGDSLFRFGAGSPSGARVERTNGITTTLCGQTLTPCEANHRKQPRALGQGTCVPEHSRSTQSRRSSSP